MILRRFEWKIKNYLSSEISKNSDGPTHFFLGNEKYFVFFFFWCLVSFYFRVVKPDQCFDRVSSNKVVKPTVKCTRTERRSQTWNMFVRWPVFFFRPLGTQDPCVAWDKPRAQTTQKKQICSFVTSLSTLSAWKKIVNDLDWSRFQILWLLVKWTILNTRDPLDLRRR